MLEWIVESFFSKVGEKLADYGLDTLSDKTNFRSTLDTMKRNFKPLSAKASDIEEEIKNAELSGKKKRKREVEEWMEQVQMIESEFRTLESEVESEGLVSRFLGGDSAKALDERVYQLVEQSRHFGELVLDVDKTKGEAWPTTRLFGAAFEENLKRIWEWLVIDNVSSIGIYGMGGVGKTTLTKHIHNRLVNNNHSVVWVTVSQEFSVKMLQDRIAHIIGTDLSDEYDEEKRAVRLHRALSSLRNGIVLILDDVWKNICLKKMGNPLSVEGCRLIITTRSSKVCCQICCQEKIAIKTLDADEAWNLFNDKLGPETPLSPEVEEIAKSLVEVCDGLPLAIITLAGSMRGETATYVWRDAFEQLQISVMEHDEMEDQVFEVLKYSFDRLDPNVQWTGKSDEHFTKLKCCFLYCSLYAEDEQMYREKLVRKFILEKLVDKRKSLKAQLDEGRAILDKLVNVCLLESCDNDCFVKMHDLARAMALKITQGKNMVLADCLLKEIPKEEYWMNDLEKMSLMNNYIEEIPVGMSPNCPKLSTLLLEGNMSLKSIPNSFFSQMHSLCVLDLSRTSMKDLPNSISELESLEALLLFDCRELECVPYLGKLKALKELDLELARIKEAPKGIGELTNLRCLRLPFEIEAPVEEIERLMHLEEFLGRVKDVCDFNRFITSPRIHKNITYSIVVGSLKKTIFFTANRVEVSLCHIDLKRDELVLAKEVQHLEFRKCKGLSNSLLDDFPRMNNPKSLQVLRIQSCEGIECILTNDQIAKELESKSQCHPLQTLEEIVLSKLPDFMGLIQHKLEMIIGVANVNEHVMASLPPVPKQVAAAAAVFSSLKQLSIVGCNNLTKLGLRGSDFPNLECIVVQGCEEVEEIIEVVNADGEEHGNSIGERHLEPVISLPKLRMLCLINLPKLRSICMATMNCSSIKEIDLRGCPTLKRLPLFFPTHIALDGPQYNRPPTLQHIMMDRKDEGRWESLEWEHPQHKHLLRPLVTFS